MNILPKYSIIIPVRNGGKYLLACVQTIINQPFSDYELIICNNHSLDNTSELLKHLDHPNIKIIEPAQPLSMTDNWEFALSHTQGQWIIFLGVDDGLQSYFFELAEILTNLATHKNIRAITSARAYYFYDGCQLAYGSLAVKYKAVNYVTSRDSYKESLKSLLGLGKSYFDLPSMYAISLFHRDLIDSARKIQGGVVFKSMCPDANLVAIACSLEKKYLESGIPLGWVGSSPNSAGFSASIIQQKQNNCIPAIYLNVQNDVLATLGLSSITFNNLGGNFKLNSPKIFYWEALLQTHILRKDLINKIILSKWFRSLLVACVLMEINDLTKPGSLERLAMLEEIIAINDLNYKTIKIISFFMPPVYKIHWLVAGIMRRIKRIFLISATFEFNRVNNMDIDLKEASARVNNLIKTKSLLLYFGKNK